MGKCCRCGADTLHDESGVPFCVECVENIEAARKQTALEPKTQVAVGPEDSGTNDLEDLNW
jgi:hypothetical protein